MVTVTGVRRTGKVAWRRHAHGRGRRHTSRRHVMHGREMPGMTGRTRWEVAGRKRRRRMPGHACWRRREWLSIVVCSRPRGRARAGKGRGRLLIGVARVFIRHTSRHRVRRAMLYGRPRLLRGLLGRVAVGAATFRLASLSLLAGALMLALAITVVLLGGPARIGRASPFAVLVGALVGGAG